MTKILSNHTKSLKRKSSRLIKAVEVVFPKQIKHKEEIIQEEREQWLLSLNICPNAPIVTKI